MARILVIDDETAIRKRIKRLLNKAGHEVFEAADGQQGLARLREYHPELILVDFVMPKMNGFQFCGAVRALPDYRQLPIVLLSARAEKVGENFIKRFELYDAISKPFENDALLALVQKVLSEGARSQRSSSTTLVKEAFSRIEEIEPHAAIPAAAEQIVQMIVKELPKLAPQKEKIVSGLSESLSRGGLANARQLLVLLESGECGPTLSGDLNVMRVPDVMQFLAMQNQTGVLDVMSGSATVSIQFREGTVELAVATGVPSEFLLGRYLVDEGILSRQDLELFLRNRSQVRMLGEQLLKLGDITEADLARALTRQTTDLVVEIQRWKQGRFWFSGSSELPRAKETRCRLAVSSLVMEGFRQVDEWRLIEQIIPDFDVIFSPTAEHGRLFDASKLSAEELLVLDLVDGQNTVREIVEQSNKGSFFTCKVLYRLASVKLIKNKEAGENARTGP